MSKWKLITGEDIYGKYDDFLLSEVSTEGNLLCVSDTLLAGSWQTGSFATVAVFKKDDWHRIPPNIHLIRAHKEKINDIRFSPYMPNLLSTTSDDATIKLWNIPNELLDKDMEKEVQKYQGHSKRVTFTNFHPCSKDIIASAGFDNCVHVWNIENAKKYFVCNINEMISSIDWNLNGNLIGAMTKNKNAVVFDVRNNKEIVKCKCHDSAKTQKMLFVDNDYFISTGFGSGSRELKLFDMRNYSSPVNTLKIDSQSGVMYPYYDYDNQVIYIPGKGENNVYFYTFMNGNISYLHNEFRMKTPPSAFCFDFKRNVNYKKNEMAKLYKYYNKVVDSTSFFIPRKNEGFDEVLYPDTFSGESALSGDEWASGVDKSQNKKTINLINNVSNEFTIVRKSTEKIEQPLEEQVILLKDEIKSLNEKLKEKDEINDQLRKEVERLKDLLSKKDN